MTHNTAITLQIEWDDEITDADPAFWKWYDLLDLDGVNEHVTVVEHKTSVAAKAEG